MYTIKQLSDLVGVTPRTLHYYDEIGLFKPESVGANGYRYYGDESLLKLQQILFYRELGLDLSEIKHIVTRPEFDVQAALESHRKSLVGYVERLNRLIQTVDDTILHLKGKKIMSKKQLFEAFSEEQQKRYEKEAAERYDPETVKSTNKKWKQYTPEEKQRILDEGNAVYVDLVVAMPKGPESPEVQACVERWRRHIEYFWVPNEVQLIGLVDLYNAHPDFVAKFKTIDQNLGKYMKEAVRIYVEARK
jgi:DNA-binding transcriptional MerR regulator